MPPEDSDKQDPEESGEKEVLDLLDPKKTPRKRAARKKTPKAAEEPAPEPAGEEEAAGPTVDDQKKAALNLFEEAEEKERKKKERKGPLTARTSESHLPPIARAPGQPEGAEAPAEEEPSEEGDADDDDDDGDSNVIHIKPPILVKDLARRIGLKPHKLIAELLQLDVFASGPNHALEPEVASNICEAHGFVFEKEKREKGAGVHKVEEVVEEPPPPVEEEQKEDELQLRAPIITFMGHVDHGKTSLLDFIRQSRVTAGEAGGITQHIGAYSVVHNGHPITFVDTPGHAAFTEMRARGANVTDIVVVVIAADDGIMPQTKEAINHAKAAGVAIMVAINKCDLPAADPERVKVQLQEIGLAPEDWGGETIVAEVSATKGTGVDQLLDLMALQAEVLELKSNPHVPARATVIEARLEAGRGPTATAIVQAGTLTKGMSFICGPHSGKVKSIIDDTGAQLKEAGPATPVEILGFSGLPNVGDEVVQMETERAAKKLSDERQTELRTRKLETSRKSSLEGLMERIGESGRTVLKLVLKSDVQGSLEAIIGSLEEIESDKIDLNIIHSGAGAITESDILLASASDAIVVGFNVKLEAKAVRVAKKEQVQVKLFSIIYELLDQIKEAMLGMLEPEHRENTLGHARVKEIFKLSRGIVAGCVVIDGKVKRSARARVLREGQPVYDGGFATLRRFKDDVAEVRNGLECGIRLGEFTEYQPDDIIECYELEKLDASL